MHCRMYYLLLFTVLFIFCLAAYFTLWCLHFFIISNLRYAESVGARHYETSAKANEGIEELFLELTHQMLDMRDRRLAATEAQQRSNSLRRGHTLRLEGESDDDNNTGDIPGLNATTAAGHGDSARARCCH